MKEDFPKASVLQKDLMQKSIEVQKPVEISKNLESKKIEPLVVKAIGDFPVSFDGRVKIYKKGEIETDYITARFLIDKGLPVQAVSSEEISQCPECKHIYKSSYGVVSPQQDLKPSPASSPAPVLVCSTVNTPVPPSPVLDKLKEPLIHLPLESRLEERFS